MIAADDRMSVRARGAQSGEMIGGIDLETVAVRRKVARGMQCGDADCITLGHAFQQAAALVWESGARFVFDLRAVRARKKKRRHGAFGAMRPMKRPSLALKM
jgi:hypothetical protein